MVTQQVCVLKRKKTRRRCLRWAHDIKWCDQIYFSVHYWYCAITNVRFSDLWWFIVFYNFGLFWFIRLIRVFFFIFIHLKFLAGYRLPMPLQGVPGRMTYQLRICSLFSFPHYLRRGSALILSEKLQGSAHVGNIFNLQPLRNLQRPPYHAYYLLWAK